MLTVTNGVARSAFALQVKDGTMLLSDLDESAGHVERLAYGYSVHHPEYGDCTVVPVTVVVTVTGPAQPTTHPAQASE